jgi:hypothetical protein
MGRNGMAFAKRSCLRSIPASSSILRNALPECPDKRPALLSFLGAERLTNQISPSRAMIAPVAVIRETGEPRQLQDRGISS